MTSGPVPSSAVETESRLRAIEALVRDEVGTVHDGRLSQQSLDGQYAPLLVQGQHWLALGDSITDGSGASNNDYAYLKQSARIAGGFVTSRVPLEYGTAGETSTQIAARAGAALAAESNVGGLIIQCGTNDAGAAATVATFAANIVSMVELARTYNIPVVVCEVPPRGVSASAAVKASTAAYNVWIRSNAKKYGFTVAAVDKALADTSTGDMLAAYTSDDVHPNDTGHAEMAMAVATAMIDASGVPAKRGLVQSITALNLITNELLLDGTTTPTGWAEVAGGTGTAPTYSLVADTFDVLPAGQWAQAHIAAGADTVRRLGSNTFSVTAGNVVLMTCHLQVEDISGNFLAQTLTNDSHVVLNVVNAATNAGLTVATPLSRTVGLRRTDNSTVFDFGPLLWAVTIPAGCTTAKLWLQMKVKTSSEYKYRIGCPGAFDVTAAGLSDFTSYV